MDTAQNPFDFPAEIVPPGAVCRWQSRYLMGDLDLGFAFALAEGWEPVRYDPHSHLFPLTHRDRDGYVAYGGQVLMIQRISTAYTTSISKLRGAADRL